MSFLLLPIDFHRLLGSGSLFNSLQLSPRVYIGLDRLAAKVEGDDKPRARRVSTSYLPAPQTEYLPTECLPK